MAKAEDDKVNGMFLGLALRENAEAENKCPTTELLRNAAARLKNNVMAAMKDTRVLIQTDLLMIMVVARSSSNDINPIGYGRLRLATAPISRTSRRIRKEGIIIIIIAMVHGASIVRSI
jgi:hypothetical protein